MKKKQNCQFSFEKWEAEMKDYPIGSEVTVVIGKTTAGHPDVILSYHYDKPLLNWHLLLLHVLSVI